MLATNYTPSSNSRKKVTVLVSTYNHEKFIAQAINSVLMQETDFEYEIVIIEDCSTDDTRDIVINFRENHPYRIRLALAEKNYNDNRAWAREMSNARSEYVAFLDGDDYWISPHKLQKQVDFLDAHPGCSICCHNATSFYEDGSQQAYDFNPPDQKEISTLDDLWTGNFIAGCSAMLRRGVVGQFPDWFYAVKWADWALYLLWSLHGKIGYINELMGAYRIHNRGLWSGLSEIQQLEQVIEFYEEMNANLHFIYDETTKIMISKHYYDLALVYEKTGDMDNAKICLEKYTAKLALCSDAS